MSPICYKIKIGLLSQELGCRLHVAGNLEDELCIYVCTAREVPPDEGIDTIETLRSLARYADEAGAIEACRLRHGLRFEDLPEDYAPRQI